jgi:hypothetical protein
MSSLQGSKQLHAVREQLKEIEQQYKDGKKINIAWDTRMKSTHPTHSGMEDEVSYF